MMYYSHSLFTDHVLADEIIEMTLWPGELSPADLATNSFLFPCKDNSRGDEHESVPDLIRR